jgi:hypothetical protein
MAVPDFGTLLNKHGSSREELFAALRDVFDHCLIRHVGTGGGRPVVWMGDCGLVGAVTEAIDAPQIDLGLLGERLTYFRMPAVNPEDEFAACVMVEENSGRQRQIREQRAKAVSRFFGGLDTPDGLAALDDDDLAWLTALANLGVRCRSSVLRDGYSREIDLVPSTERSPRLFGQLRQLHAGLEVIGTPPAMVRRVLAKAALDGMHPGRRAVIEYLVDAEGKRHRHRGRTLPAPCDPDTPTPPGPDSAWRSRAGW